MLSRSSHGRDLLSYLPPPAFPWCGNVVDKCVARGNDKRVTRARSGGTKPWAGGCRGTLRSGARAGLLVSASRGVRAHRPLAARLRSTTPGTTPSPRARTVPGIEQRCYSQPCVSATRHSLSRCLEGGFPMTDARAQGPAASPGAAAMAAIKTRRAEETVRSSLGTSTRNRVSGCTGSTAVTGRAGRGSDRASSSGAEPVEPSRARRPAKRRRAARAEAPTSARPTRARRGPGHQRYPSEDPSTCTVTTGSTSANRCTRTSCAPTERMGSPRWMSWRSTLTPA